MKTALYLFLAAAVVGGAVWFGLFDGIETFEKTLKRLQTFTKDAEKSWGPDKNRYWR
jgi:hypothetical protein